MRERQGEGKLAALRRLFHIEQGSQTPIHTSVPDHPGYRPAIPEAYPFEEAFMGKDVSSQRVIDLMNDPNFMKYAWWRNMQQDRLQQLAAQGEIDPHSLIPDNWQNVSAHIRERLIQSGWTDKEMLVGLMVARGTVRKPETPQR